MTRALRLIQTTLLNVAAVVGGIAVLGVLVALILGARPAIVISGSMEPDIPVGAMTFSRSIAAEDAQVGSVVTLQRPDGSGLVTHRVVANEAAPGTGRLLTLKGDANREADSQPYQVVRVGEVRATVPYLGTIALWMQHNVLIVVGLVVLIGGFVSMPIGRPRSRAPEAAPEAEVGSAAPEKELVDA